MQSAGTSLSFVFCNPHNPSPPYPDVHKRTEQNLFFPHITPQSGGRDVTSAAVPLYSPPFLFFFFQWDFRERHTKDPPPPPHPSFPLPQINSKKPKSDFSLSLHITTCGHGAVTAPTSGQKKKGTFSPIRAKGK